MPNQKINVWLGPPIEECGVNVYVYVGVYVCMCVCLCVCVVCVSMYVFIFYSRTHHDTVAVLIEGTNKLSLKTSNLGITPFTMVEVKVEK